MVNYRCLCPHLKRAINLLLSAEGLWRAEQASLEASLKAEEEIPGLPYITTTDVEEACRDCADRAWCKEKLRLLQTIVENGQNGRVYVGNR